MTAVPQTNWAPGGSAGIHHPGGLWLSPGGTLGCEPRSIPRERCTAHLRGPLAPPARLSVSLKQAGFRGKETQVTRSK